MDKIYKSLADENRRMILSILKEGERNVNQILGHLKIGQATLSSHLQILRKAGLVSFQVKGKQRVYKLEKESINNILKDIEKLVVNEDTRYDSEIIIRRIKF